MQSAFLGERSFAKTRQLNIPAGDISGCLKVNAVEHAIDAAIDRKKHQSP
jgi:hypothetical protein